MIRTHSRKTRRRGAAYLVALILLAVLVSLAVGYAAMTDLSLVKGANLNRTNDARMAAESGLSYTLSLLYGVRMPAKTNQENFADKLAQALGAKINGMTQLGGHIVSSDGTTAYVPEIALDGGSFVATFTTLSGTRTRLDSRGTVNGVTRTVSIELDLVPRQPMVFDYGLASRGPIVVSGNANIVGVNNPAEANVMSATTSVTEAITVDGNVTISGGLGVSADNAQIVITGSPSIAGSTDPNVYADDIRFGVDTPDFPALNLAPLQALAVNTVDSTTDIENKATYNNVRIAAGTNPTFTSKVTLNGVVYVEAPNVVQFEGGANLNGFLVTEDDAASSLTDCQVHFAGHVEAQSVDTLPDTAEFADVKQYTGTFIVAPGFGITFAGSFSAINGSIAADQLTFTGNAEGIINGSVIGLQDNQTVIGGNVDIYVDREAADSDPAGFLKSNILVPLPDTYTES